MCLWRLFVRCAHTQSGEMPVQWSPGPGWPPQPAAMPPYTLGPPATGPLGERIRQRERETESDRESERDPEKRESQRETQRRETQRIERERPAFVCTVVYAAIRVCLPRVSQPSHSHCLGGDGTARSFCDRQTGMRRRHVQRDCLAVNLGCVCSVTDPLRATDKA